MVKICKNPYTNPDIPPFSQYPFELDHFQKHTIEAIEKNIHVLNTAHTGSGKTLGAEYIIQKYCPLGKKVIYTSPIKSLSNQKFHEFSQKYPHISFGVLTGDIKFNPEADCLIMTTEILRNFLFNQMSDENNDLLYFNINLNDLAWVIFDEVHYINDTERGKVWEETIMMLPNHVRLLMLSATIENAPKFAQWVEDNKKSEVWIASTNIRSVPLTHYSFLTLRAKLSEQHGKNNSLIDNQLHKPILLRNHHDAFQDGHYSNIAKITSYFEKNRIFVNRKFILNTIVKYLNEHNMLPAIFFVFSRKKAEEYARNISLSLLDGKSTNIVEKECSTILRNKLPNYKEYIQLPEYVAIVKLLTKGIAVHHSGIHPVFKEMIELMFSRGFIKVLFATETFAVGINMPTKSVVFTSLQKFDGSKFRYLLPHEYTQMAGRAGRRGLDKEGRVFHLNNMFPLPSLHEYKQILCGKAVTIDSKFTIHYNLILRLMSIGDSDFEGYVQKSMLQDSIEKEVKYIEDDKKKIMDTKERKRENLQFCKTPMDILEEFVDLEDRAKISDRKKKKKLWKEIHVFIGTHKHLEKESAKIREIRNLDDELEKINHTLLNTQQFISNEINTVLNILVDHGFIKNNTLTETGIIASNIQEVHCLVFAIFINEKAFDNLTPQDLICVLSCFSNISIPYDDQKPRPTGIPINTQVLIEKIQKYYYTYYQIELDNQLQHRDNYQMHFELCDIMGEWCQASNEAECKAVYQKVIKKGIFLGEFIKTILKINNIALEMEKVCKLRNNLKLLEIVKQIPMLTLKSVATNQSLYL
jgi:superfamily II RNA helicase